MVLREASHIGATRPYADTDPAWHLSDAVSNDVDGLTPLCIRGKADIAALPTEQLQRSGGLLRPT